MKILIVDDQPVNRLLLREIVGNDGHQSCEAADGREALEVVRRESPDIILLDIMMPEMDGLEACRELRKEHSMSDLPILFITARAEDEHLVEGFQAGGNDYISKPLNATVVRARIRSHVRLLDATRMAVAAREEALAAKRLKTIGVFAAGVAHSINSLATTILGRAEALRLEAVNRDDFASEKSASLIVHGARRAIELGESLVTIVDLDKQGVCVNISDLVRATEALVQASTAVIVNYQIEMDRDLPSVGISTLGLSQILLELLENSISSINERGTIALRVNQKVSEDGLSRATVVFSLSDSGSGLPEVIAEKLREYAALAVNKNEDCGLGLGLRGVVERVHDAEGEFRLISSDKSGTTIEIELPAV